jgi:hypothetical protein
MCAAVARADETGTWIGTITYIRDRGFGVQSDTQVKGQSKSIEFVWTPSFDNIWNADGSQKLTRSALTVGTHVTVTYLVNTVFSSYKATKINVGGGVVQGINSYFNRPVPSPSP